MRLLTILLLTSLAAITFACPGILKNPAFIGNDTHTAAELLEAASPQTKTARRWVDTIDAVSTLGRNRYQQRWPKDPVSRTHIIWYCYEDESTHAELSVAINAGLKLWYDKIGKPGIRSGHALDVRDATDLYSDQPWCFLQPPHPYAWNPKYGPATVVIGKGQPHNIDATATAGYHPQGHGGDHYLVINPTQFDYHDRARVIAHEFGHIFGLTHEHQRQDRDKYYHFECKNVENYEKVRKEVKQVKGPVRYGMTDVCKSAVLGMSYNGFGATQFSKENKIDENGVQLFTLHGPPDPQSIMQVIEKPFSSALILTDSRLYASHAFMRPDGNPHDWRDLVLVKWKPEFAGNHHPIKRTANNCDFIDENKLVSNGDRDYIQIVYPWN